MFLVENMHLAKDALHIYVALGVFFGSCLLFGWKASQWRPVMAVLAVALAGESWDLYDTLAAGDDANVFEFLDSAALKKKKAGAFLAVAQGSPTADAGIAVLIEGIEGRGLRWGIVTNKAARFTVPLVRSLGLHTRAATVIAGDTTPHSKPHPAPLLEAARQMGLEPGECLYVGDDPRDVQAGLAAGMTTVVAAWGYLGIGEPMEAWGARHIIKTPAELLNLLGMA